jgi:hypothetical protein
MDCHQSQMGMRARVTAQGAAVLGLLGLGLYQTLKPSPPESDQE